MKKCLALLIPTFLTLSININAQQTSAKISFDETEFDFGKIDEEKGVVTHRFEFTNTGNQPLIIQNVSTTCGCTVPSWTREPVKPGEKGFVSAAYNPAGRPGAFSKFIIVQSTSNPNIVQLKITGQVNSKPLSIEDQYPFEFGGLRLKTNHVSFGNIYKGQEQTSIIEMINASDKPLRVRISNLPEHIKVNIPEANLSPKQTGIIEVTFNSSLVNDWGFVMDRLNLFVNDQTNTRFALICSANLDEDFSSLSAEQKANAPSINFDNTNFNFGTAKRGETVIHEYKFTNKGKSNLLIRKVVAACGCTAVNISDQVIAPGKSGTIKTSFNTTGYTGKQSKTITVISNDPNKSKVVLWIRGEVVDPTAQQ